MLFSILIYIREFSLTSLSTKIENNKYVQPVHFKNTLFRIVVWICQRKRNMETFQCEKIRDINSHGVLFSRWRVSAQIRTHRMKPGRNRTSRRVKYVARDCYFAPLKLWRDAGFVVWVLMYREFEGLIVLDTARKALLCSLFYIIVQTGKDLKLILVGHRDVK